MSAAFGFVSSPRTRDPGFVGSTNNSSKRQSVMIANRMPSQRPVTRGDGASQLGPNANTRPEPVRAPQQSPLPPSQPPRTADAGILGLRCDYLEGEVRHLHAVVIEQGDQIRGGPPLRVGGEVIEPTVEFADAAGRAPQDAASASTGSGVAKGVRVQLLYPMEEVTLAGGRRVIVMRRLQIDPDTAGPKSSWLVVYEHPSLSKGVGKYLVGRYTLS